MIYFWDWINPLPKVDQYQTQIDAVEFEQDNEVLISAIAWEGFEKHGKGLVLLEEKKEGKIIFKYISRYKVIPISKSTATNLSPRLPSPSLRVNHL